MSEKRRLLFVEDDFELCKVVKHTFADHSTVELVDIAHSGQEAVAKLADVDIVVLDLIIPQMDGIEVLERINQLPQASRPSVIVASSFASDEVIRHSMALGARYFMVKPYTMENLQKRIAEVVEGGSQPQPNTSIAPLPNHRNVTVDEKISSVFLTVGIPAHIKGYHYLRYAIKLVMENGALINRITKELYPRVAEHFETSPSKVERAIRHAIEVAWTRGKIENINALFGFIVYNKNEKPTNGEFIALVADKLAMEQIA